MKGKMDSYHTSLLEELKDYSEEFEGNKRVKAEVDRLSWENTKEHEKNTNKRRLHFFSF